jgi:hypothetical protein
MIPYIAETCKPRTATDTTQAMVYIAPRAIARFALAILSAIPAVRAIGRTAVPLSAPGAWEQVTIHQPTQLTLLLTVAASADITATRHAVHDRLGARLTAWLGEPVTLDIHIVALAPDA